ncbi:hypothetical protein OEG92_08020 [Polaribacter sejongensis]|uniref:hypothetical protein n=1 Tax=Polaribacter sejongensis TaxID=985043 RepID=UPI0035A59583
MICQSLESLEREKNIIKTLLSNRVDGVLISISMETTNYKHLEGLKKETYRMFFLIDIVI